MNGYALYIDSVQNIQEQDIAVYIFLLFYLIFFCYNLKRRSDEAQNYYYKLHITFIDSNLMVPIGDTYESTLYDPTIVDTNAYSANIKDFFYFLIDNPEQTAMIVELVLVSLNIFLIIFVSNFILLNNLFLILRYKFIKSC